MKTPTTIAIALMALGSGCIGPDAECYPDQFSCDGNVAFNCAGGCIYGSCKTFWEGVACEGEQVCIEADDRALCALSSEPDPSCTPNRAGYCADDRIVSCDMGLAISALDCAETGGTCTENIPYQCVLDDVPDPRCPNEYNTAVCDGDVRVECWSGYATRQEQCPAGCAKLEGNSHAMCLLPDPEERCPAGAEYDQGMCWENHFYYCYEGKALVTEDCTLNDRVCGDDTTGWTQCWERDELALRSITPG